MELPVHLLSSSQQPDRQRRRYRRQIRSRRHFDILSKLKRHGGRILFINCFIWIIKIRLHRLFINMSINNIMDVPYIAHSELSAPYEIHLPRTKCNRTFKIRWKLKGIWEKAAPGPRLMCNAGLWNSLRDSFFFRFNGVFLLFTKN